MRAVEPASIEIEGLYPLSPMQGGLLFHCLMEPESCPYVSQVTWELEGALDLAALREVWQTLIDRHTILRTAFVWEGLDEPLQVVSRHAELPFRVRDLRGLTAETQRESVAAHLAADRRRPLNLSAAPLLRLAVLRVSDTRQHVVWTQHHLLLDGWSTTILLREAAALYAGLTRGAAVSLSAPQPFANYIAWLAQEDPRQAETYWRETLRGAAATPLPQQGRRAAGAPRFSATDRFALPAATTAAAIAMARAHGMTVNTLVQGAWAIWLGRHTGQDDVLFGSTVSGRTAPLPAIDDMVGLFVNTLPVRARIEPDRDVAGWLAEFQRRQADARRYEHVPLTSIQAWSGLAGQALFDTLISFHNFHVELPFGGERGDASAGGALRVLDSATSENPHYTLSVVAGLTDVLTIVATYDPALLPPAVLEPMMRQFQALLERIVITPACRIGELSLLTRDEELETIAQSTGAVRDYGHDVTLNDLITPHVERSPDRVAVSFDDGCLTYAALDAIADRWAAPLAALGAGPESLVAVHLERSAELVIALLAVLKAGAAYVPLDFDSPPARLARMLEDADPAVIVTSTRWRDRLPADARVVCVENLMSPPEPEPGEPSAAIQPAPCQPPSVRLSSIEPSPIGRTTIGRCTARPDGLAYVIYTSGTTGTPKGAMNTHTAIVNRLSWMQEAYGLTADDRVLQKTPFGFDVAVWEFFWPLIAGATVVMLAPDAHRDPRAVVHAVVDHSVTTIHFVPSMLREFLRDPEAGRCTSLRLLFASGEALDKEVAEAVTRTLRCAAHNLYGPTEAAVDVTFAPVDRTIDTATVPIGWPIANVQTYVLHGSTALAPIGVSGELYLGGAGPGRGYLHRPDTTAATFVPDPFSGRPGARLYRTGDLVRRLDDGRIEFLRRIDHQVKIRGNRIELGDVEHALTELDGVAQAIVIAPANEAGDRYLAAYVVPEPGASLRQSELRDGLERRLPAYMTPAAFVILDRLPLGANGKIDRQALPAPTERMPAAAAYEPPRTPVEEIVAGIWEEVLRRQPIGRNEQFLDVGGHSLLAMQVIARVRGVFRVELPLRTMFEAPTVAGLAAQIEGTRSRAASALPLPPPIVPFDRNRDLPLSFEQQRLWFLDQLAPGNASYNLPFAWCLTGPLHRPALARAFNEIVRRHEILRTSFPEVDGAPVMRVLPDLPQPPLLDDEDLSRLDAEPRQAAARRHAQAQAERPFDVQRGPLLRVKLLRMADEEHVLLVTMHHLVSDAWSLSILAREVGALYDAFVSDRPSPLAPPPLQFGDFAVWQREWLQADVLRSQLDYWTRQLDQARPLELPLRQPRSTAISDRGAAVPLLVRADLSARFKELLRREGVTLFMGVLACWQLVLSRYAGQQDVLVGSGVATRRTLDVEGLIGFFVNTLVLRTQVRPGLSFAQLLAAVRETVLRAHEHQDVPFEKVVEALAPARGLGSSSLVRVMLVLQNAPNEEASITSVAGLRMTPAFEPMPAAKQEITLYVWEDEGAIAGSAIYKTDLLERSTVVNLMDSLVRAIAFVCASDAKTGDATAIDVAEIPMGDQRDVVAAIAEFVDEPDLAG